MPSSNSPTGGAGLVQRLLPDHADRFTFESLDTESSLDTFEVTATYGQVRIRGTGEPARTAGLYRYLSQVAGCSVTWDHRQLDLPGPLPATGPIRATSPWPGRYYFNPCTFSYSTAFWDWARWEREIDWMALHGITMPLALTGQEGAIWQTVYRDLGLTDDDIAGFCVGPGFLPFGWMGCLDAWGTTPAEQDRLEGNARTLVTLWGNPGSPLNDYSRRHWSGLLAGFYLPRWQRWAEAIAAAFAADQPVDETAVTADLLAWEEAWTRDTTPFPADPTGDARDLFARYAPAS